MTARRWTPWTSQCALAPPVQWVFPGAMRAFVFDRPAPVALGPATPAWQSVLMSRQAGAFPLGKTARIHHIQKVKRRARRACQAGVPAVSEKTTQHQHPVRLGGRTHHIGGQAAFHVAFMPSLLLCLDLRRPGSGQGRTAGLVWNVHIDRVIRYLTPCLARPGTAPTMNVSAVGRGRAFVLRIEPLRVSPLRASIPLDARWRRQRS